MTIERRWLSPMHSVLVRGYVTTALVWDEGKLHHFFFMIVEPKKDGNSMVFKVIVWPEYLSRHTVVIEIGETLTVLGHPKALRHNYEVEVIAEEVK